MLEGGTERLKDGRISLRLGKVGGLKGDARERFGGDIEVEKRAKVRKD